MFDKTGTLTVGRPVTNIVAMRRWEPEQVLAMPPAQSLTSSAGEAVIARRRNAVSITRGAVLVGLGMRTWATGRTCCWAVRRCCAPKKVRVSEGVKVGRQAAPPGRTPLLLAVDGTLVPD